MSDATHLPAYSPLTFSQILERICHLLRADARTQFGIALLPGAVFFFSYGAFFAAIGVTILPAMLSGNQHPEMPNVSLILAAFTAVIIVHLIALALFLAASSYAGVKADCGTPVNIKESYAIAGSRAGHYMRLVLSMYGICFGPMWLLEAFLFAVMAAFSSSKEFSPVLIVVIPLTVLLLFGALIGGVIVALRLSVAFPVSVCEALNVRESIKRSWRLTRGAGGRIFLVMLVVYAGMYVAMMAVMMIAMVVAAIGYLIFSAVISHPSPHTIWVLAICGIAIYMGVMSVFSACLWAGFAASLSVIYNDQRLRIALPSQNSSSAGAPA